MNETKLSKLTAILARCSLDLAHSNRKLQQGIDRRKVAEKALKTGGNRSTKLLAESQRLQQHLQEMSHKILTAHEDERKELGLRLQDEIVQTLSGIHIRLLALKKEVSASNENFKKELVTTQRLVRESVRTVNRFAHECGIRHEN